jgi:hypothetical protein
VDEERLGAAELEVFALVGVEVIADATGVHFELLRDLAGAEVDAAGLDIADHPRRPLSAGEASHDDAVEATTDALSSSLTTAARCRAP